jgi:putative PEP-CTERM system histidine kinase
VHDLKNLIAQLSLIAKNAEKHRHNPAFIDDAFLTIDNAVKKMTRLMSYMRSSAPDERRGRVELSRILKEAIAAKSVQEPVPRLVTDIGEIWILADPDRMEAILGHVIQNAQDATNPTGSVEAGLHSTNNMAIVEITDDGAGMDELFIRERLFRPFDSTKGLTGMGVGAYECREFIHSLGGRVEVYSKVGEGTRFKLIIPLADTVS